MMVQNGQGSRSSRAKSMARSEDVHVREILTEVQHAGFQGRGSASLLQMCPEQFGRRL